MKKESIIFVVTAPSGAGKTSLCWAALKRTPGLKFSVSHTTRPSRPKEQEGVDYHFVDNKTFDKMIIDGKFIEWAPLYDFKYGTSIDEVDKAGREDVDILIEIDRQGAKQIREKIPESVGIFIMPPSIEILRERLTARGTEKPEELVKRLAIATDELEDYVNFDYAVINDEFERAVTDLQAIILSERCKLTRQQRTLMNIVKDAIAKTAAK